MDEELEQALMKYKQRCFLFNVEEDLLSFIDSRGECCFEAYFRRLDDDVS